MYRLHIQMANGNCPFIDYFTLAEAQESAHGMATNRHVKSTRIEEISFAQWRLDHV